MVSHRKMIYLMFLFVLVTNIRVSISALTCGAPSDYRTTNKITLITLSNTSTNSACNGYLDDHDDIQDLKADILNEMNCIFMSKCSEFYEIGMVAVDDINTTYEKTLQSVIQNVNIVNLFTSDFYNFNTNGDDKLTHNRIIYAGDVYDAMDKSELETFNLNGVKITDVPGAKIMSRRIAEDNPDLFAFITSMYFSGNELRSRESCIGVTETVTELTTVLVCSDKEEIDALKTELTDNVLNFKFVPTHECSIALGRFKNRLLAVLAPFPFETDHNCLLPTIFYRLEHKEYHKSPFEWLFPNSVNLFTTESPGMLKHAFMKVIMDAGWHRIAIISDYSPFSMDFEAGLLPLLAGEGKLFNVHHCREAICFKKALTELVHIEAKVVIANVNRDNAEKLLNIYKRGGRKDLWIIFRVKPFWNINILDTQLISITMGPDYEKIPTRCSSFQFCNIHGHKESCQAIVAGLSMVANTHHQLINTGMSKSKYLREFTKTLTRYLPESMAYLTKTKDYLIAHMKMSRSGVVATNPSSYLPFKNMPKEGACYIQRSKFDDPCNINIVLLFMFVIIVFSIIILTITCYFENTSPLNSKKYQQL